MLKHGRNYPLNRREVMYYNVQIGSESELMILRRMIDKLQVPVSIAVNALSYGADLYNEIEEIIRKCISMGYESYIVADPGMIDCLSDIEGIKLTVSGELGEMNAGVLRSVRSRAVKRIIFPRQTTISEMKVLCSTFPDDENIEYEAFALNEKCHFTGAYCNSYHCDELCHICRVPYRLVRYDEEEPETDVETIAEEYEGVGMTGCALCHLWKMKQVGVTHLKLVSRGNSSEDTVTDIQALRRAIDILEEAESEAEYVKRLFDEIFPNGCSGNCYAERGSGFF